MSTDTGVAARLAEVRERIAAAARGAGRNPSTIRLVVVTKDVPLGRIFEAVEAGATDLGENRAQELLEKMDGLAGAAGHRWHFIGTLQRNKAKLIAGRVVLIHSVDSEGLGREVAARAVATGGVQDALLEVNVSGEPSKHGVAVDRAWELVAALSAVDGIRLRGLMTIAPPDGGALAREAFAGLRELRDRLRGELGGADLDELSMGMTSDFEIAIEEGATIVRIGSAIFGPRR